MVTLGPMLRGIGAALAAGAVLSLINDCVIWEGFFLFRTHAPSYVQLFQGIDFLVMPLGMGLAAAYQWRGSRMSAWQFIGYCFLLTLIGCVVSAFAVGEGVICLLIASPIIVGIVMIGALIGGKIFAAKNNNLNASVVPVLLALMLLDSAFPHELHTCRTDTLLVHAPPARVWPHVPSFAPIKQSPAYWVWKLGLPYPVYVHSYGMAIGARRDCVFSGNAVYRERIDEIQPGREFGFTVVSQPRDPEIFRHVNIDRGQITLVDNHNGSTTLVGRTWYSFKLFPTPYFNWWAKDVAKNVHYRAMGEMKRLAESNR